MMPEPEDTDEQLLERWANGDARSGEHLFGRYFQAVARFFRNKVDGPLEDLVQQTFLGCLEGVGIGAPGESRRFRGEAGFRSYLFGVARNVLRKHYRTKSRGREVDFGTQSVHDIAPSPSAILAEHEDQALLLDGLRHIPLDGQILLELHYWEQLPGPEIAAALDIPVGTFKTQIRRAKQQLREAVDALHAGAMKAHTGDSGLETWARSVRSQLFVRR